MKFTVNRNDIRDLLAKVQGLTGRKTNLSITETVLIKILEGEAGMTLLATDLEKQTTPSALLLITNHSTL